ncbi:hypothetical protein T4B_6030 [Trichinella pseudospiralis]|uniref:DUF7107 domain-containing protein n=1 Tax=Trichinella pseudospiralis TaxID=6337 RepID=A0A0V1IAN6_TRIPS|nr:hypothetical protein T4A_13550 [Trichinella pseudospiralis]KRZ19889.1 hypothetical protein T4B_6030 [Trichinella pseudospiralis]KRZ43226.1 hypothetical protein T4C_2270 [Trichinella pseudospiralis]
MSRTNKTTNEELTPFDCDIKEIDGTKKTKQCTINMGCNIEDVRKENHWPSFGTLPSAVFFDHFIKRFHSSLALIIVENASRFEIISLIQYDAIRVMRRQHCNHENNRSLFSDSDACLQSSQCNNLALCFRRQCISAEALYGQTKRCSRDIDCRRQLPAHERLIVGCKNGICAKLITVPNAGKCATRNQCPGQSICFRRHCIPAVPRNYSCQRNAQCHPTERCIGGLCFGLLGTTSESTRMLIGYPDDDTIDLL